jgi:1-deoxy-D-xylulose-5-phosphate synthase
MQRLARQAGEQLKSAGCNVAIVNPRFVKPLDAGTHEFFGGAADVVVTLEDHALPGGYGSAVMELFAERQIVTPVVRIGWPDQFIEHGSSVNELRAKYGLSLENVVAQAKAALNAPPAPVTAAVPVVA